ncbi:MAG: Crp/Fnr family transcriptional regulator [Candidatus Xenobia bacterium]
MAALRRLPLFSHLSDEHLTRIGELAQPRHLAANAVLWTKGDQLDALVVITSGRMKVLINSEDGREVTLNVIGPDHYLGDMSVMDRGTHSATVMAVEASDILWIPGAAFRQVASEHPRILWELLLAQTQRIRVLSEELACIAMLTTCRRVARKVLQIASDSLVAEISHQELAGMVGSTRESVTRALAELEKQGLLTTRKQRIEIQSLDRLRHMVEEG